MRIPEGFNTIAPYFFCDDPERFAQFLHDAFGGVEQGRTMRGKTIANLRVRIGDSTLMISQASDHFPAMASAYYLYVEDADKTQAAALKAGASEIMPVADMDYGDRQGGVKDPFGNYWWVSQRLVDAPYEN